MSWQTQRDDRAQAAQEARRGRDRGQVVAAGTRQGVAIREGMDRLHGPLPILRRIHDGVCTAVDTVGQRATFAVPDILPDGVLRGVRYWPRAPRVGEALPVFVGEDEWVWCEPPGTSTVRWLYFRPRIAGPSTTPQPIRRIAWPITADAVPEVVGTLDVSAAPGAGFANTGLVALFGYHTGTRQIYAVNQQTAGTYFPDEAPADWRTWLATVTDWGFGTATHTNTGGKMAVYGVLDDASPEVDRVGLLGIRPVESVVTWNALIGWPPSGSTGQPDTISTPLLVDVVESSDAGGTWTARQTVEYLRPVTGATWPGGMHPGGYQLPARWPPINEPLGGLIWRHHAPGVVLVAPAGGLPTGARVWPLPSAVFTEPVPDSTVDSTPVTYDPTLAVLPDGSAPGPTGLGESFGFWGGENDLQHTPIPLWVRQAADGTWVVYALLQVGAPVGSGMFLGAPEEWYRGTGTLGALSWTLLGTTSPAAGTSALTALAPAQLLAVSVDGQSLVAWTVDEDGDGFEHRIGSDDYGATWTELPVSSTLLSDAVAVVFDDMLLVDIPADDPRATEQP